MPTRAANKKQTFVLGLHNLWNAVGITVTLKRPSLKPLYTSSCPEGELDIYLARWEEPCCSCWVALFLKQLATWHITANKRSSPHNAQEHQTFKPVSISCTDAASVIHTMHISFKNVLRTTLLFPLTTLFSVLMSNKTHHSVVTRMPDNTCFWQRRTTTAKEKWWIISITNVNTTEGTRRHSGRSFAEQKQLQNIEHCVKSQRLQIRWSEHAFLANPGGGARLKTSTWGAAEAQEVERVVHLLEDQRFDSRLLQCTWWCTWWSPSGRDWTPNCSCVAAPAVGVWMGEFSTLVESTLSGPALEKC